MLAKSLTFVVSLLAKYLTAKTRIMSKVIITQVRSAIGRPQRQKDTIQALGLKKLNVSIEKEATPQIMGMINKVSHLLKVEEK